MGEGALINIMRKFSLQSRVEMRFVTHISSCRECESSLQPKGRRRILGKPSQHTMTQDQRGTSLTKDYLCIKTVARMLSTAREFCES